MNLVEFVPPVPHPLWKLCPQMGITDVIVKVNPELTGLPDPWRYETLASIVGRLAEAGLRVVGLEGDPFDMSPIKEYGSHREELSTNDKCHNCSQITNASSTRLKNSAASAPLRLCDENILREEALAHYRELLESMGRLGIKLLCYNFMVGKGWARTGVRDGRGGAKATYFSMAEMNSRVEREEHGEYHDDLHGSTRSTRLKLTADQVWANYAYFIKSVMPTAEKCGIRMGLHPDDPCLPSLGGYARVFGSVEAYDRAYTLYPSPSNAVTFCQANFKLMGADLEVAARHFGDRIAFIHVRDVEGTKEDFTELFHDQGTTDQFALMRVYRELGLDVPVRGDHVPEMAYDRQLTPEGTPGYFTLGRLFANGFLQALLKGTTSQP